MKERIPELDQRSLAQQLGDGSDGEFVSLLAQNFGNAGRAAMAAVKMSGDSPAEWEERRAEKASIELPPVSNELDVCGYEADFAVKFTRIFINDALRKGYPTARIFTARTKRSPPRRAVHQFLDTLVQTGVIQRFCEDPTEDSVTIYFQTSQVRPPPPPSESTQQF